MPLPPGYLSDFFLLRWHLLGSTYWARTYWADRLPRARYDRDSGVAVVMRRGAGVSVF